MASHTTVQRQRFALLDGLRFVAALAVVLYHYTARDSPAWDGGVRSVFPDLGRVTLYGGFGPYLFFMISGFVVLMSAWGRSVPSFLASRVGRLFPAYWFAVVFIAGVLLLDKSFLPMWAELGFAGVSLNLTMVQSAFGVGHVDGVFWSLWIELKFYVLIAVLAHIGLTTRRALALCFLWPIVGSMAAQSGTTWAVAILEPTYAPFFCLGIVVYLVHRDGWSLTRGLVLAVNYLIALWFSTTTYIQWTLGVAGAGMSRRGMAVLLTACLLVLMAVTLTRLRTISWPWLTVLGSVTYPLYLLHEYPGWMVFHHLQGAVSPMFLVLGTIGAAMLLSYAVHRFVELPLGPVLRRVVERELTTLGQAEQPRLPVGRRRPRPPLVREGCQCGEASAVAGHDVTERLWVDRQHRLVPR